VPRRDLVDVSQVHADLDDEQCLADRVP